MSVIITASFNQHKQQIQILSGSRAEETTSNKLQIQK